MTNLREQAESDLVFTLEDYENGFGLPVQLVAPDGVEYTTSANDATKLLAGRVDYDTKVINPETGEEMIIKDPHVTLRRSSLARVPLKGETGWSVRIPLTPSTSASLVTYRLDDRAIEDGGSLGTITLRLTKAVQQ